MPKIPKILYWPKRQKNLKGLKRQKRPTEAIKVTEDPKKITMGSKFVFSLPMDVFFISCRKKDKNMIRVKSSPNNLC